jgi:phytoene dehydrogenase-like protein
MAPPKVVIIGAGMAGLSCGCYLQMNGVPTEILEAEAAPGGLCTSWNRGEYLFEGCLQWLLGTDASSPFHVLWEDLGALTESKIIPTNEIIRIEGPNGETVAIDTDLEKLAARLKRVGPEDAMLVDELIRAAMKCARLEPLIEKPLELMNPLEKVLVGLRYLPLTATILRWRDLTLGDYLARYRHPFLRVTLLTIAGDARMSALVLVMLLAFRSLKNSGFVPGGSRSVIQGIASRYASLGGRVRTATRVTSIEVEQLRATGVHCADGQRIRADAVVSCADGRATLFGMLGGRFLTPVLRGLYEKGETFPGAIQVSLGVNQAGSGLTHVSFAARSPLLVDDQVRLDRMEVSIFGADAGLCPSGKSVITALLPASVEYWTRLRTDHPEEYAAEKERVLREVVRVLDDRFPGLAGRVEETDVATPATFTRHTGNWRGSRQGWLPTPRALKRRLPLTLPGLRHFYMAGHWAVVGGGLPLAALSGKQAAQMVCAQFGKPFRTSEPSAGSRAKDF